MRDSPYIHVLGCMSEAGKVRKNNQVLQLFSLLEDGGLMHGLD